MKTKICHFVLTVSLAMGWIAVINQAFADEVADVEAAKAEADKAQEEVTKNRPSDATTKKNEDELDQKARVNDDTPGNAKTDKAKEKAQTDENTAEGNADKAEKDLNNADKAAAAAYRQALKERRVARKKLRAATAKLKVVLQKRRGSTSDNADIEKAVREADEELIKVSKAIAMVLPTDRNTDLASLASAGKVKIDSAGTGETIGHIADLKVQNLTNQPLTCAIPPMILESGSGKNQHYACPKGQTVVLNPHQEKTVPMDGVCVSRNKPPVGKGVTGDLVINEGNPTIRQNPNSHIPAKDANELLRLCTSKYDAADKLQRDGALKDLPYNDKQKQKDIVTQWSTWCDPRISELTGAPPATKEDLRKVVYKQVPEPMTPATKKKIDKGIDTIFEKVELTTAKAKDLEKPDTFAAENSGESLATGGVNVSNETPTPAPQTQEKLKETPTPAQQTQEKPKEPPTPAHNEMVVQVWWQYFTGETKEGLDNLKRAIAAYNPEDRAAIENWIRAVEEAGKQEKAVLKAHVAIDKAKAKLHRAKVAATNAEPKDKAAVDKDVSTAQTELDNAKTQAEEEEGKAKATDQALKQAEKGVDRNVREMLRNLGEQKVEKPKQERANEDVPKSVPPSENKGEKSPP